MGLLKETPPLTSVDALEKLQTLGIIPAHSAYIDMVKFRNFIVHRYEKIDLGIVYATIKNRLSVFREFVDAVRNAK
jgi:uncharacterized protein YutE (UPF0331/DUF86 family)